MEGKCLACHMNLEKPLLFCSITCACLGGYMSVRSNFVPKHTMKELGESPELRKELLERGPLRERPERKYL